MVNTGCKVNFSLLMDQVSDDLVDGNYKIMLLNKGIWDQFI